jgi:hypothetical protein
MVTHGGCPVRIPEVPLHQTLVFPLFLCTSRGFPIYQLYSLRSKNKKNKKTLFEFGFCITINTSSQELFTEYT